MELEKKFQDQLIIHYGGSGKDVKKLRQLMEIPEKPKKPASGCLHYIAERRKDAQAQHPDMSATQITKFLADEYGNLSIKERKKYEEAFERGMNEYHMAIEAWRKYWRSHLGNTSRSKRSSTSSWTRSSRRARKRRNSTTRSSSRTVGDHARPRR